MSLSHAMNLLPLVRRSRPAPSQRPQPESPHGRVNGRTVDEAVDPRCATFREINELSLELYLAGDLGFPESAYFGRQPELHPAYARTVGRLTRVDADRDAPRDHLRLWEDRLAFAERYLFDDRASLDRLRRIVGALRRLAARIDVASGSRRRLAG